MSAWPQVRCSALCSGTQQAAATQGALARHSACRTFMKSGTPALYPPRLYKYPLRTGVSPAMPRGASARGACQSHSGQALLWRRGAQRPPANHGERGTWMKRGTGQCVHRAGAGVAVRTVWCILRGGGRVGGWANSPHQLEAGLRCRALCGRTGAGGGIRCGRIRRGGVPPSLLPSPLGAA